MPNTTPALDEPGVLAADPGGRRRVRVAGRAARARRGDGRAGGRDAGARSASWRTPASSGFSDDGAPVRSAAILRNALAYAGALGLPIIDHAEDPTLTDGAEANDGLVATVLGPARLAGARPRRRAVGARPRDPRRGRRATSRARGCTSRTSRRPRRSSSSAARRRAGLPVTCDVTPHHLALTDEWVAGARRWAWDGERGDPWADGATRRPRRTPRRCGSTRRCGRPDDAPPAWPRCGRHGRRGRHGPRAAHRGRQGRRVRAGGERDQRHRDGARAACSRRSMPAGCTLLRAIEALTVGPARRARRSQPASGRSSGSSKGAPADLVVFDRSDAGRSTPERSRRRARTRRCSGMTLPGRVLLTMAGRPRRLRGAERLIGRRRGSAAVMRPPGPT